MPALILMYHDLLHDGSGVPRGHTPYVLAPATFAAQTRSIASCGLPALTVAQWCAAPRPPRAVVVTFDDGHASSHTVALPLLLEHSLRATFFITAGAIGSGMTMTWPQIRELHAAGMEIGSHTVTHRPPAILDDDELRYELVESRRILEDGLGAPVVSISSPTGFFNPRMRALAREAGYRALCIGSAGFAAAGDSFALKRIAVKRSMDIEEFKALLRFDTGVVRRLRVRQMARGIVRSALGPRGYLRVRHALMSRGSSH